MMPTLANAEANSATCDKRSGTEVRGDSEKANRGATPQRVCIPPSANRLRIA
jgi:hypothetical protein